MTKPFGKGGGHHGRTLTKGLRFAIAFWIAAIPAYFLCLRGSDLYPTLSEHPFFGPATLGFLIFYAIAITRWFTSRPSPRAPGTSSSTGLFVSRLLLSLVIAFPLALASGFLYEPAFQYANGMISPGSRVVEHALVDRDAEGFVLDCPYWEHGFRWKMRGPSPVPKDLARGSLATMTLRRGIFGARWIETVEFTVLK